MYMSFPYYGRWIWSAAKMLIDKRHIAGAQLIVEVKARYETS
jgi:Nitrile hydratase beta subunit